MSRYDLSRLIKKKEINFDIAIIEELDYGTICEILCTQRIACVLTPIGWNCVQTWPLYNVDNTKFFKTFVVAMSREQVLRHIMGKLTNNSTVCISCM